MILPSILESKEHTIDAQREILRGYYGSSFGNKGRGDIPNETDGIIYDMEMIEGKTVDSNDGSKQQRDP